MSLKSSSLHRGHHLFYRYTSCIAFRKTSGLNRAWSQATRTIVIRLRYYPKLYMRCDNRAFMSPESCFKVSSTAGKPRHMRLPQSPSISYYIYCCTTTTTSALPKRRPTGFHAPRHGPVRVQPAPKRAEERFIVAMKYFPTEPKPLVHTLVLGKKEQQCVVWIG